MVGVQEANPFRESASALLGGGQPLSSGVERNDISQFARRINFPAKSTIFNESEPSVAIYQLSSGRVTLQETVPAARIFPPDLRLYALRTNQSLLSAHRPHRQGLAQQSHGSGRLAR